MVPDREHAGAPMAVNKYDLCNLTSLAANIISGRNLFRSLLSHPTGEQKGSNGEPVDHVQHPQIGLVCSLLTDTSRQGPEVRLFGLFFLGFFLIAFVLQADELKSRIIMFLGMLSNADPGANTLLIESQELVPSIVLYLCHLVVPIWEENGVVFNDPEAAMRCLVSL